MFRCWPDGRFGGNEGSASSGRGVALVPPAAAAEAVEDCRAAAADAAAQEPSKKEEDNEADDQPSPPDWTTLSIQTTASARIGITDGNRGEALVSSQCSERILPHTLSTVDLLEKVVDVILSLIECLVGIISCISAEP